MTQTSETLALQDLFVIGGGVNGCGIARDAAGRGLTVVLAEAQDLGGATSSASSKLIHGGLRYLEYYEFGLVRHSLKEREVLLAAMPHIAWPMRFVLPHHAGLRPRWLLRLGLFLYDHLGGRKRLAPTRALNLRREKAGAALKPEYARGFEYSDGWVDDARLVVLNARDAAERGATILTRASVTAARRLAEHWEIDVTDGATGAVTTYRARKLVNAAGPWVAQVIAGAMGINSSENVRLVRGSHIVVPRMVDHDQPYILQRGDGRIVFAIPYEDDFTLIGTTDADHEGDPRAAVCTDEEADYLIDAVGEYFVNPPRKEDIVWTYSGVRPLYDDGASSASAATRDYVLSLDTHGPPVLNIFGGKITTYRHLAEEALARIGVTAPGWTAGVPLPGGDFGWGQAGALAEALRQDYPFLTEAWARRLVRLYGTDARAILGTATAAGDLGQSFGGTLTEAELIWLRDREFAETAEDVLWRRSKLGLRLSAEEAAEVAAWFEQERDVR